MGFKLWLALNWQTVCSPVNKTVGLHVGLQPKIVFIIDSFRLYNVWLLITSSTKGPIFDLVLLSNQQSKTQILVIIYKEKLQILKFKGWNQQMFDHFAWKWTETSDRSWWHLGQTVRYQVSLVCGVYNSNSIIILCLSSQTSLLLYPLV